MPKRVPVKPVQPNQSIESAINCLMEVTGAGRPVTCTEMAERLGVERTKAGRLLGTLAYLGMLERLPDLSYIPGPGIHVLSAMSLRGSGLLRHALPHIQHMKEKWNMDARLGVLWRDQVSLLYHSVGDREVADSIAGARPWPAAKSTIGKVLLAQKDDDEIRAILGQALPTEEYDELMAEIGHIRECGYVMYEESLTMAIGTPVTAGLAFKGKITKAKTAQLIEEVRAVVRLIAEKTKARS